MKGRVRLVAALGTAVLLATTMLYVGLAADEVQEPVLQASELVAKRDLATERVVQVDGVAAGPVEGDLGERIEFFVTDHDGGSRTKVRYAGSVPDAFRVGRTVIMKGQLVADGAGEPVFEAVPGTLVTKCPSKFESEGGSSRSSA